MAKEAQNNIFESFLKHNRVQSAKFTDAGETLHRRKYRAKYPAAIAATKCMDGRLNFPFITETPMGIIQPFRDIGGKFKMGSHFGELLLAWVKRETDAGKSCIVFVTYHYSKSLRERGCKGFKFDKADAMEFTRRFIIDISRTFGEKHDTVYPIQVGIETDEDALILHGGNGDVLDMSKVETPNPDELLICIKKLFPGMDPDMVTSLVPILAGNVRHIAKIREMNRPLSDIDHKEYMLGIGRGFDWFHSPNEMLIVGPYDLVEIKNTIAVAGKILLHNIEVGNTPREKGLALVSSAVYRDEAGPEKNVAEEKARYLAKIAYDVLREEVPDLIPLLSVNAGILNENNRLFTPIQIEQ